MLPKYKRSAKLDIPNSAKGPRVCQNCPSKLGWRSKKYQSKNVWNNNFFTFCHCWRLLTEVLNWMFWSGPKVNTLLFHPEFIWTPVDSSGLHMNSTQNRVLGIFLDRGTWGSICWVATFPVHVYSTSLSPQLDGVDPDWIMSHYAQWAFNKNYAVVLNLSCVCAFLLAYVTLNIPTCRNKYFPFAC